MIEYNMRISPESIIPWKPCVGLSGKSTLVFNSVGTKVKPGVGSKNLTFLMRRQAAATAKPSAEVEQGKSTRNNQSSVSSQPLGDFHQIANIVPVPMTIEEFDLSSFHEFKSKYGSHALEWEMVEELETPKATGKTRRIAMNTPDARRSIRKIANQLDRETRTNTIHTSNCLSQELEQLVKFYLPMSLRRSL